MSSRRGFLCCPNERLFFSQDPAGVFGPGEVTPSMSTEHCGWMQSQRHFGSLCLRWKEASGARPKQANDYHTFLIKKTRQFRALFGGFIPSIVCHTLFLPQHHVVPRWELIQRGAPAAGPLQPPARNQTSDISLFLHLAWKRSTRLIGLLRREGGRANFPFLSVQTG